MGIYGTRNNIINTIVQQFSSCFSQVIVGHLRAGDCIGEMMLRGCACQPYTIISATRLRVGWVNSAILRGEHYFCPPGYIALC